MPNKNQKFSFLTIVYIVLNLIILFSFVFLPWIELYNGTKFSMAQGIIDGIYLIRNDSGIPDDPTVWLGQLFSVSSFIFIIIPILLLVGLFSLLSGRFQNFNNNSVGNYVFNMIFLILIFIIKIAIDYSATKGLIDEFGVEAINNAPIRVQDLITLRSGIYLIFLTSAVGFFINRVTRMFKPKKEVEKEEGPQEILDNSEQVQPEGLIDAVIEVNQNPPVTLFGKNQKIDIPSLPATLGRNENEVDVPIKDETISRVHCQILKYEDGFLIVDKNSSVGTFINNDRLEPEEYYQLFNGDNLRLGDLEFNVYLDTAQPETNSQIINYQDTIMPDNIKIYSDTLDGTPAQEINEKNFKTKIPRSQTVKLQEEPKLNQTIKLEDENIPPLNKTIKLEEND